MYRILILILFPICLLSQERADSYKAGMFSNNLRDFAVQKIHKVHFDGYIEKIGGRYYLNKKWNKCYIKSKDNKSLSFPCNYNLHSDRFEMKVDNDVYFLKDENIQTIIQSSNTFIPLNKNLVNDGYTLYYELLSSGKNIQLIKRYKLKLSTVQSTNSLGTFDQKITIKEKLFFLIDNSKLIEVPKSKSKLLNALNLDAYLKSKYKKANLKKTEILIALIKEV